MTAEELKELFATPLMLLLLMSLGAIGSAAKQLVVARRAAKAAAEEAALKAARADPPDPAPPAPPAEIGVLDYFARVETAIMLGHVAAAWLGLLYSDTLNIASALGAGYVANDFADAYTKEGRSAAMGLDRTGGSMKSFWLVTLLAVAIAGAMILPGCTGTRAAYASVENLNDGAYVLTEHYRALVKEAADLKEKGAPAAAVEAMQRADQVGKPVVLGLRPLVEAFTANPSPENEQALQEQIDKATVAVSNILKAISQARDKPTSLIEPPGCPRVELKAGEAWSGRGCHVLVWQESRA